MGILRVINPSTEELYGALDESSFEEIERAVETAQHDTSWASLSVLERVAVISKLSALLEQHKEEFAKTMAEEIGKPLKAGRHEVDIALQRLQAYCQHIPDFIAQEILYHDEKERNIIRYEPKGVVAVITPWNAPVFLSCAALIPPLLCGNTVLYKPSEYASFTGITIAKLFDALKKEGLPDAAFRIILGGKEVGKYLVTSSIDMVTFTGSVQAGQDVMRTSADRLHSFLLELGGKDPAIVLEDADIERATHEIVKSATMYTGQVCFGVERCYCHTSIYTPFVQKCIEAMKQLKVGNPLDETTDLGPLSVKFQLEKVLLHLKDALEKGARLVYGGERLPGKGYFLTPGILTNVNHQMRIMREETFGPLLPIMQFSSLDEALALANDSDYGLTASIWTRNLALGEELAAKIQTGTVEINRHGMSKADLPWGGVKKSGIGRIYSKEGIHSFTHVKHVWVVR